MSDDQRAGCLAGPLNSQPGSSADGDVRKQESYTIQELFSELRRFEDELRKADKQENTIRTYVDRSAIFVRWLAGNYHPIEQDRR